MSKCANRQERYRTRSTTLILTLNHNPLYSNRQRTARSETFIFQRTTNRSIGNQGRGLIRTACFYTTTLNIGIICIFTRTHANPPRGKRRLEKKNNTACSCR